MKERRGPRRALSDRDGAISSTGSAPEAGLLKRALERGAQEEPDTLTHGFHSYPARMHPAVVRTLLEAFRDDTQRVLDPFCGSGTTLVEARVAGMPSVGVDLNPLALRVAEVKIAYRDAVTRERFVGALRAVGEASFERVQTRVDSRAPLSPEERSWYEVHTLKELAGLFAEVKKVEPEEDRRALEVLFSAIVPKFSKQRADTAEEVVARRIRKGLPTEFFLRKGEELARRWEALVSACPPRSPSPRLRLDDARRVRAKVDLIVTSPPYGGTYDYLHHHGRRLAWLKLDASRLAKDEIGARRRQWDDGARFARELAQVLRSFRGLLPPRRHALVLIGDARFGDRRVDAARQMAELAKEAGLELIATASQARKEPVQRPDRSRGRRSARSPRREHLVWLRRLD